jgi:uncharacterized membrane protein YeaQ/YmgE (transglycosylase-associated protein family)
MNVSQILGLQPISWPTILVWALCGLVAGLVLNFSFWGSTPGGSLVTVRFALIGAALGAFLGLCYYVVDPANYMKF